MTKSKKTIGWNGKTIREMLKESEELFKETGCYYGLSELKLKKEEPIRYEKMFSRLRGGTVSARETALNIAASPIVKEEGELCFALYTPEGDSIVVSTGILVHIHTMSDAIKYIIRNNYEEDPGIAPGDIFINNDCVIGDVHNVDVATMVPIFWENELIGWSAGVTHEVDVGASMPVGQTDTFDAGLVIPALKIGENDTIRRDYQIFCQKRVRTPMYWNLDERTRLAGCHLIREAVFRLIAQEGIDTYKCFIRELIEDGRRVFMNRIKELLVPGTYRSVAFIDVPFGNELRLTPRARKDTMMQGPLELKIGGDGSFRLSFDGASTWGWHSFNCTPTALQGAMWVLLSQTIIPNDKVNDGAYMATNINLPVGSWTNSPPIASNTNSWHPLVSSFTGLIRSLSRGFQARGFVEEVISSYAMTQNLFQGQGIDDRGNSIAFASFEISSVGGGAGMIRDGLDYAAAMWNPEGDMGDVETWEILEPFLYLGRRVKPNTGGGGKFRGGSGFESLRMCRKVQFCEASNSGDGKVFCGTGLFGGYPGGAGYRHNFHDTDIFERARAGKSYPIREGSPDESELSTLVTGREILDKRCMSLLDEFKEGDLYLNYLRGAAGLGDPLERTVNMVIEDLNGGYITEPYAKMVYGVIARKDEDGKWKLDQEETTQQRKAIRQQRAQRSVPVNEWLKKVRERVLKKDFIKPITEMYASSMNLSESWAKEYKRFWDLPDNFTYEENK